MTAVFTIGDGNLYAFAPDAVPALADMRMFGRATGIVVPQDVTPDSLDPVPADGTTAWRYQPSHNK